MEKDKTTSNDDDKKYLNKPEDICKELHAAGIPFRIQERNGKSYMMTRDYDPKRLNFVISQGIIVGVSRG